jgi:uncharacterized protein (TIGR04255 family)
MSVRKKFIIDLSKEFQRLPDAPIVEAVLHWQAAAGKTLDKAQVQKELGQRFPKYDCREQQQQQLEAAIQKSPERVELRHQTRWDGFRLTGQGDANGYVVQFKPNGVVFSRLAKYDRWTTFQEEGLRFWEAYLELAEPPVIKRLGVRFINQIRLGMEGKTSEFLKDVPTPPKGMGLSCDLFFHQDTFRIDEYPYQINWVRTVQRNKEDEKVLIVDIDASTERIASLERDVLMKHLAEMRFLKNKLFFTCMTEQALKRFGEDDHE